MQALQACDAQAAISWREKLQLCKHCKLVTQEQQSRREGTNVGYHSHCEDDARGVHDCLVTALVLVSPVSPVEGQFC